MSNQVISRELLSSVREQLLSSAKQSSTSTVDKVKAQPPSPPTPPPSPPHYTPSTPPRPHSLASSDSCHSADPLLDELLGDIRRSCGTSLASTPTAVSSDGDWKGDSVFECKLRRSRAELHSLSVTELRGIATTLSDEVDTVSALLVKLLRTKDRYSNKMRKQCQRLTLVLKDYASQNGLPSDLCFSLAPPTNPDNQQMWLDAWRVLSRLPRGISKHWRKTLWSELATHGTSHLDWESVSGLAFSEFTMPGDEALGSQIVKDLHRTGTTGFTSEQEHAVLKRVLLAYARFNSTTGYCQGFNVLAALILKVMNFDEHLALRVMVYLVDHVLPENYFSQNLYALSVDMAVFRDYLKHFLPELSSHLEGLQKEASGLVKKSYSSENPPDIQSIHAYEPPLADVFTMQWFLTLFATSLPRKAVRRVWDLVFLEGSRVLIHTAVAILAVMERELLQTVTAADFYTVMAQFGERLRKAQLLPSSEFMEIVYAVQDSTNAPDSSIPSIGKLREKYTYNIYPWAVEEDDQEDPSRRKQCPPPTCGGSLSLGEIQRKKVGHVQKERREDTPTFEMAAKMTQFQKTSSPEALTEQMKQLREHYTHMARQPQSVRCNLSLTPPQARIVCPQTRKVVTSSHNGVLSYAADVPDAVLERSRYLSGYSGIEELAGMKKNVFTISYCQTPVYGQLQVGRGLQNLHGNDKRKRRSLTREEDLVIRYTTGQLRS